MPKLLLVDDDPAIIDALSAYLKAEDFEIDICQDGALAFSKIINNGYDLIILDVMLPHKSGTEICKEVRKVTDVPIMMLTAKDGEIDRVVGLELGADDYLSKPFSPRELAARIKAILRRGSFIKEQSPKVKLTFGKIVLYPRQMKVVKDGQNISCTKSEFAILAKLIESQNQIITREQMMKTVTGFEKYVSDRTIDTHVKNLRKKIEDDPKNPKVIVTVRGVGYRASGE